jgi:hypothetical protein
MMAKSPSYSLTAVNILMACTEIATRAGAEKGIQSATAPILCRMNDFCLSGPGRLIDPGYSELVETFGQEIAQQRVA